MIKEISLHPLFKPGEAQGPNDSNPPKAPAGIEPQGLIREKVQRALAFGKAQVAGARHNCDKSRKTPWVKEEIGEIINKKVGLESMVVEGELAQVLGPDPDFSSSPLTYVPPEDPQILAKFTQPKIDLSQGAKITRGLPDPLGLYASLIRSATSNSEIADSLVEDQMRGTPNGPGPSQLEPFSFNPLHRWMAPNDEDDYGPESGP